MGKKKPVVDTRDVTGDGDVPTDEIAGRLPRPVGLLDLYTVGAPARIEGIEGRFTDVWLQKLSGGEHQQCVKKASAAKARIMAAVIDPATREASEEWQAAVGDLLDATSGQALTTDDGRRSLARWAFMDEMLAAANEAEQQLIFDTDDEDNTWAKDGYLEGLIESWSDGLDLVAAAYPDPEDDPDDLDDTERGRRVEARRVRVELLQFLADVRAARDEAARAVEDDALESNDLVDLRDKAAGAFLDRQAQYAWLQTFHTWRVFYSVRTPDDHAVRYFPDASTVDRLDDATREQLIGGYDEMALRGDEGKESPPQASSSPPSGLTEMVASMLSGLPDAGRTRSRGSS